MNRKLALSAIVMMLMLGNSMLFAQTTSKGDTLIVGPISVITNEPLGALNEAIKADITTAGARAHKVYKLLRNEQYILTDIIQGDFPLVIVADKPDKQNRPPIIRGGLKEDGSAVGLWWQLYDHATFKNLWISGINLDGTGPMNWIGQEVNTVGKTIWYDGCIVEYPYTWWAIFADWGGPNNYKITNCIFQYVGNPTSAEWNGAIFHHMRTDSVLILNSTFYDFGCFAANTNPGCYYMLVDHCSFVNSMVHAWCNHRGVKQIFTNNLLVNDHSFSDDAAEISRHYDVEPKGIFNYAEIQWDPQELDSLWGPKGVFGKKYDPNSDGKLTDDELVVELKNNAWWFTAPIKNYWQQYANIGVKGTPWMNGYNRAMFDSKDSTGTWTWMLKTYVWEDSAGNRITNPTNFTGLHIVDSLMVPRQHMPFKYFKDENTKNVDPGIKDMNGTDELLAQNCIGMRIERAGGAQNTVKWHGVSDYLAFTWPLDYDLSYTNKTLENASTDGKPVGSLQWWPNYTYTGVEKNETAVPVGFELNQNYPNPFNPTTTIAFTLAKKGHVELKVYNLLGAEVATLVNEVRTAGKYSVAFDASRLASGIYFYQLKSSEQIITRKMTLMK